VCAAETTGRPTIGFVGLGRMGTPMAGHLAKAGWRLIVSDARPEPIQRFVAEHSIATAGSLPEIGKQASVVITMLPDINVVRDVVLGSNGLASSMPAGSILLDMSSSSPSGTIALGAELAKRDIHMIDAPVSGGVPRAITGELSIMAGGDAADINRCEPILKAMGKTIFRTGKLGTGQAMKALNNLCSAAGLLIAAEVVRTGRRFGLDADLMVDILNASTGQNNATLHKFKPFILPHTYDSGFGLDLMVKDLAAALELSAAKDAQAPFSKCCVDLWKEAQKTLGSGHDHTAIDLWLERLNEKK
jgi:3-hydroxyisobutyrate dehydrogenase